MLPPWQFPTSDTLGLSSAIPLVCSLAVHRHPSSLSWAPTLPLLHRLRFQTLFLSVRHIVLVPPHRSSEAFVFFRLESDLDTKAASFCNPHFLGAHSVPDAILRALQADLGETVGQVPDPCNEVNIPIKPVTWIFWFPSAYKSYVCSIL